MKTSNEYIKDSIHCPVCGLIDIEGGPVEIEASIAWQNIVCNECHSAWTDQYTLIGYSNLIKGSDNAE